MTDDPAKNCLAGNDLYFDADTDEWNKTLAREGSFRNCFSNLAFPRIVVDTLGQHVTHAIRFPMNASLLSALLPSPSLVVSVRDDGNYEAGCGMSCFLACKTLGSSGKNQQTFSTGEVLVEAGLFEERMGFVVSTEIGEGFTTISSVFDAILKYLSFIVAEDAVIEHIGTGKVGNPSATDSLLSRLESFPGGSSTDSIPSVEVLILSANQSVTHSTMLSLLHITQHCPERLQEKHVETSRDEMAV
ncbi:hypothetical protein BLNAU_24701 [Blattamonas nauphoetae]|uniref:Uncharacterized protein n=1 Tax=Blattamonas nauphoetae TaxID=2049346 RepID=A0ABQ9WQU2_9EUKA|nr:hypothetical protein BLNAU_24701 [Blattamonas nauphoetae]